MTLDELLARAVERMEGGLAAADEEFMRLCGRRLAEIGIKSAEEAEAYFRGHEWADAVLGDVGAIRRLLDGARRANNQEMKSLVRDVQAVAYDEARALRAEAGRSLPPFEEFARHVKANPLLKEVAARREAMGRSSAASALYRRTIGGALAEMTGGDDRLDYPRAMRKAIRSLSERGMGVVAYASGYKRRLDSSVRADLMDEIAEVVQGVEGEVARAVGADGWEVSAHGHCAEDHEDIQGLAFTSEEFEKLQSGAMAEDAGGGRHQIRRPVGKWNCRHIAHPVILGASEPAYSRERLAEIKARNAEGVEFRGKRMALYEATQRQRKLETEMRRERGRLACVREVAGADPVFKKDVERSRARIKGLRAAYKELGEALGPSAIRAKWDRSYNVRGGKN
jgi:hypothetical protein